MGFLAKLTAEEGMVLLKNNKQKDFRKEAFFIAD